MYEYNIIISTKKGRAWHSGKNITVKVVGSIPN